jgi:ABC-type uncharacterized transport system substrate-binding protein
MLLWRGETKAEAGFKYGLKKMGYSVTYTIFNASQSREKMADFLRLELLKKSKQFDYVYSFGTTATKMAREHLHNRIPHIFNVVTAPVEAGIVKSMKSSEANVSGVSHSISLFLQFKEVLKIKRIKKLGFFFNPREKNSEIIWKNLIVLAKIQKFKVVIFPSALGSNQLENHLKKIVDGSVEVDIVYLPMDSYLISNASLIGKKLREAKVMSIGAQKEYIDNGALLGNIPDYYQLGEMASQIIDRHQKGEKLSDIPIQTVIKPKLVINEKTRKMLNIKIPLELLKRAVIVKK